MNTNQKQCCEDPTLIDLDKSRVTLIDEVYGMKQNEWDIKTCLGCKCLTFIRKDKAGYINGKLPVSYAGVEGSTPSPAPKKTTKIKTRRKR